MAVIKGKKASEKIKAEQKRQEAIRRKMEIQRKKADFGETWRQGLSEAKRKELEKIVGDAETPKILDSIDINNFFDPISFYKDNQGQKVEFNYEKYIKTEQAYEKAIKDVDREINGEDLNQDDNLTIDEIIEDSIIEEEVKKQKERTGTIIKVPRFLQMDYKKWTKYFYRFVPLYNKYICSCCGQPLDYSKFYPQYVETNLALIEDTGKMHSHVCMNCCKKIYEYLYYEKANKDPVEAMKWYCSYLNIYYSETLYYKAKTNMQQNKGKNHIVHEYMLLIDKRTEYKNKTFLESDINFGVNNNVAGNNGNANLGNGNGNIDNSSKQVEVIEDGWTKEDIKNRKLVIKMIGYDVFDYETDENRKILYRDFLGMLDQGMEMDQVKMQAAVQIVISFLKVREFNKLYRKKESEGASVTELKGISELQAKELKTITDFSKDNGFSERYANAKSKGENSFTGIMNKMDEAKYENALINKYDIETSTTIQQAANASMEAIMKQLSLGEAEVWQTCQQQLKIIEDLRRENSKITEDLRTTKYELAKIKLLDKAKEQGTLDEDDDDFGGF